MAKALFTNTAPLISPKQLEYVIEHLVVRLKQSVTIWGPPGCGKSVIPKAFAKRMDYIFLDFRLNQYESVDLHGFPGTTTAAQLAKQLGVECYDEAKNDNIMATWHIASTLPFEGNPLFPDDKIILVFFDEFNGAVTQGVFAVFMQMVNEFGVGEHKFKKNVRILCAGNREGDKSVAVRTPKALDNRMTHFEMGYDAQAVSTHFGTIFKPYTAGMAQAFMNFKKGDCFTFDPQSPDKAFATYRTWEKALVYFEDDLLTRKMKELAMAGCIGPGLAEAFWSYLNVWQIVQGLVEEVLKDPRKARVPNEESERYAVAVAVSGEMTKKNADQIYIYLQRLDPEYLMLAMHLATSRDEAVYATGAFIDFSKKYNDVLDAA